MWAFGGGYSGGEGGSLRGVGGVGGKVMSLFYL